ncbi:hypothetical protein VTI74DRAFT_11445 [Chaetomium olivicolor]
MLLTITKTWITRVPSPSITVVASYLRSNIHTLIVMHYRRNLLVCRYFVNNVACPGKGYCVGNSHKQHDIQQWKQQNGSNHCIHGVSCQYLMNRLCLYSHTDEEREQTDRSGLMVRNLEDREAVLLDRLVLNHKFVSITQDRDLASYNILTDGEIAVPGLPPRFQPLKQCLKVQGDRTNQAVHSKFPKYVHPFEPMLRSIEVMQPSSNIFKSADVISNSSNLRKLFHLFRNEKETEERYDVEARGSTLLLGRWNEDPALRLSFGYGAGFEKATCSYAPEDGPVLQDSKSHYRVMSYSFGDLQCVVQSEADAYHCDCDHSGKPSKAANPPKIHPSKHKKSHSDPLPMRPDIPIQRSPRSPATAFAALTLDDPGDSPSFASLLPLPTSTPSDTLRIHHTGRTIPSSCLIELKTQTAGKKPMSPPETQLYFARRTKLYFAYHYKGEFRPGPDLAVEDMTERLRAWEQREQATLRKVVALLKYVRERVREMREQGVESMSLVCRCDGTGTDWGVSMRLCERKEGGGLLPA